MPQNSTRCWPLRTTDEDVTELAAACARGDGGRRFLWIHVTSQEAWRQAEKVCVEHGLDVLTQVPDWFVLACRADVPTRDRMIMCRSILESQQLDAIWWRGEQFGYPQEDVEWYHQSVTAAWCRFHLEHGR